MVLLSHPTGNSNVRQALMALHERQMLSVFYTTLAWDGASGWKRLLPAGVSRELERRAFPTIPEHLIHTAPLRELCRVLLQRAGMHSLVERPGSPISTLGVYRHADRRVAEALSRHRPETMYSAVYAYDGGALETFRAARRLGVKTVYELPTAHTGFKARFFREEAELQPEFAGTFHSALADAEWLRRKDEELELADQVIVPSRYVESTLPAQLPREKVRVIPYGAPVVAGAGVPRPGVPRRGEGGELRVLFVGNLTQGKGLSYLLDAIGKLDGAVEFTMIGGRVGQCKPLDAALSRYRWIPSLPHAKVLEEMSRHDVLAFPSLSEGFGLVILEAMACGMTVITTPNTGGVGVIRDGVDGFIVPIRSAEALAEKLEWLAGDRDGLQAMRESAQRRAREYSWERYRAALAGAVAGNMESSEGLRR